MVLCHSMNAGTDVVIPWDAGYTQTFPYAKQFISTYCTHRWWGWKNFGVSSHAWAWGLVLMLMSHLVKLSLPNILPLYIPCIRGCMYFQTIVRPWELEKSIPNWKPTHIKLSSFFYFLLMFFKIYHLFSFNLTFEFAFVTCLSAIVSMVKTLKWTFRSFSNFFSKICCYSLSSKWMLQIKNYERLGRLVGRLSGI